MTWGVDDVDLVFVPKTGGGGGGDGDAALLLLFHPVHLSRAVVNFADLVFLAGVEEDALGRPVVVVLPASMCAMIPMLRIRDKRSLSALDADEALLACCFCSMGMGNPDQWGLGVGVEIKSKRVLPGYLASYQR